ncbi:uncharacterized protein LOC124294674 [Neodiprion lecontei]|uniref:Uncharacterized protein LOC124294674 n=1 Tax=Neodiprion lecontei TaxID=441921 RepID=A0ABM3G9S0_NEOLC|nr:uncharacterized protein LOC124294674 [Neodiprion lecontei]
MQYRDQMLLAKNFPPTFGAYRSSTDRRRADCRRRPPLRSSEANRASRREAVSKRVGISFPIAGSLLLQTERNATVKRATVLKIRNAREGGTALPCRSELFSSTPAVPYHALSGIPAAAYPTGYLQGEGKPQALYDSFNTHGASLARYLVTDRIPMIFRARKRS